jgi:hypothetical protein
MWSTIVPITDDFIFNQRDDTRSWKEIPAYHGWGMPDMNGDGHRDNLDLRMLVQAEVSRLVEEEGATITDTLETLDRDNASFIAVASDRETGTTVAGTFNYETGALDLYYF